MSLASKDFSTTTRILAVALLSTAFMASNVQAAEPLLAANFNGKMIAEYTAVVGVPAKDGVKFGAIYSPTAKQM